MPIDTKRPGFIQDPFDERDVWLDEVLGSDEIALPKSYKIDGLAYEPQGAYPYCVSMATTTAFEHKRGQEGKIFSPNHLFHHSGGGLYGSGIRANLNTLVKGGVANYEDCPMPDVTYGTGSGWLDRELKRAQKVPFNEENKIKGYARVPNDPMSMRKAMIQHGPLIVGVYAGGDYYNNYSKRTVDSDNHCVLMNAFTERGDWGGHDSLWWVKDTGGQFYLDASYTFNWVYVITELPENWREIRDKSRKEKQEPFEYALNHYGKPRNYTLEKEVAEQMRIEFSKFNNQSVWEAAGKFWPVYINAIAYGGYSLSYTKWGKWMPGDIINDCYHWRRTGQHIWDLNKPRVK